VPLRWYLISLLAPLLILLIAITILYGLAAKRYREKEYADNQWISGRWGETAKPPGVTSSDFLGAIVRDPPAEARVALSGSTVVKWDCPNGCPLLRPKARPSR
jgi:hypothetical protein